MKYAFFLLSFGFLTVVIQSKTVENIQHDLQKSSFALGKVDHLYMFSGARIKRADITPKQKEQILNGLKGAASFFKFLEEKNFFKTLTTVSSVAGPIFAVASTMVSVAFLFINIESPEMALMKKEFKNLNNRIDRWEKEFDDIKKMIHWSAVKVHFSDIEGSINNLYNLMSKFANLSNNVKDNQKKVFINKYDTDYKSAGDKLYLAMVRTDRIYSKNIFKACQEQTQFHRRKVQEFMTGMVQLLTRAIQIEAFYASLKHNNSAELIDYIRANWETKLQVLQKAMNNIDTETKNKYITQYKQDLDDALKTYEKQSNEQFLWTLYNLLAEKYDWREWFVVIYNKLHGFKHHTVVTCQGTYSFRKYGRNVVVSSVERSQGNVAMRHIERNKKIIKSYKNWKSDKSYARGLIKHFSKKIPSCTDADTRLAVAWGSNVWFMHTRLVVYQKNCVSNKRPCYNTFLFA